MLASRAVSRALGPARRGVGAAGARFYHENIVDHYENPRNVGSLDKNDPNVGTVGPLVEQDGAWRLFAGAEVVFAHTCRRAWWAPRRAAT